MPKEHRKRLPLISIGVLLLLIVALPPVFGMISVFNHIVEGGDPNEATRGYIQMSFHPAFMACATAGLVLIVVGILRRK